ncbi:MAG: hypothetical protein F2832_01475 [Actinobacteria bacterium]|nr:hypothetical protein [Actinomycetota bacterium]
MPELRERVDERGDDRLDPAVRRRWHRDPWRGEHGDPQAPLLCVFDDGRRAQ